MVNSANTFELRGRKHGRFDRERNTHDMIDVHAHVMPQAYFDCLQRLNVRFPTMPPPPAGVSARPMAPMRDVDDEIESRLLLMDEAGVRTQLLSPTFAPYFENEVSAVEAAQAVNDALIAVVARAPDRLRAYVSLPLPHIEASLAELHRSLEAAGVVGVTLQTACHGRSLADPIFEPLYAELNRKHAVVFLHPNVNGLCSHLLTDWNLTSPVGPTIEDAVAAIHLMVATIPHRYPDIKFIIPHLGGGLATLVKRLDNQLPFFAALPEAPSITAKRFWYDSCCHGSAEAMHAAVGAFGADRILPGSDYPLLTLHENYVETFSFLEQIGLEPGAVDAIRNTNAAALFPEIVSGSIGVNSH